MLRYIVKDVEIKYDEKWNTGRTANIPRHIHTNISRNFLMKGARSTLRKKRGKRERKGIVFYHESPTFHM